MGRDIIKGIKLKSKEGQLNPTDIAQAIENGIQAQARDKKDHTQKKTFAPSTIAYGHGTCARFWNIAFSGTDDWDDDVDSMGLANMGVGSLVHDYVQKALDLSGIQIESEVEIELDDPPIRGFLDSVIDWQGEELVCEIKTTRQESFIFKQTTGKPSVNHLIQLLIYLRATGRQRGFLLYVNKNDETMLVIPVEMDAHNSELLDNVFEWLRTVRKAYDDDTMPKIPFRRSKETGLPSNNICRNCPVRQTCFTGPEGTVLIPLMEVPKL